MSNYQSDTEIWFYDGNTITQLTDNAFEDCSPQINNNDWIVWRAGTGSGAEILLYDGYSTIQITTDDSTYNQEPKINDLGWVVWRGYDDGHDDLFVWNGTSIIKATNDQPVELYSQINNNGYIVWYSSDGGDDEIFLATPDVRNPNLEVSPQLYDFGELTVNECTTEKEFTISNTGTGDLIVNEISLTDFDNFTLDWGFGGTIGLPCMSNTPTLAPGQSCSIKVSFCPTNKIGNIEANLTILSNDPDCPNMSVPLRG
jgi:hypothetical protein